MRSPQLVLGLLLCLILSACGIGGSSSSGLVTRSETQAGAFQIVSGSENRDLAPIVDEFAKKQGASFQITYKGSVDIMRELEKGASGPYDAVWPANSLWISLGDTSHIVKQQKSIWRSPVVMGVKKSVAQSLGWVGRQDVSVRDILAASQAGKLRFMMTSATQSNSGASAYFGFLYAFAGQPEVLTTENLQDPAVRKDIKEILGGVNRTAGSSGFLEELFLKDFDSYDGMVNYENLIVDANQKLTESSREPLYVIYPRDGLAIADSPLGYVDKGDAKKAELFQKLQEYLLKDAQPRMQATGRRVGLGLTVDSPDPKVFNPDWGINTQLVINPIVFPPPEVIREALNLYQTTFRKPSFTVFCLDFSGSMAGDGERDLKSAMRLLLNQQEAEKYLLQTAPDDVNVVIPFNSAPTNASTLDDWTVQGNDAAALQALWGKVNNARAGGGTNIYLPLIQALQVMKQRGYQDFAPAVILMTDGKSDNDYDKLVAFLKSSGTSDVPVYSITFGEADDTQLDQIAKLTSGRVFDGKSDLVSAFREAKGYN